MTSPGDSEVIMAKTKDQIRLTESDIATRWKERELPELEFYRPGLHRALFALPAYLEKRIKRGRILTDNEPYVWRL